MNFSRFTIEQHHMNYKPWYPHSKVVRTRGEVNQTALVIFWFVWVINIEL
jgi:hypothetical protein